MPYTLPTFNLNVKINRFATGKVGPGNVLAVGNLAWGKRTAVPSNSGSGSSAATGTTLTLLLPAHTDIRDAFCVGGPDYVECPSGTGRWYQVVIMDDIGKGFANEHRAAVLQKSATWPVPVP